MEPLNALLILAIVLAVAFVGQRLTSRLKLPTVTGYILLGVLLGGSLVGIVNLLLGTDLAPLLDADRLRDFSLVGDLALMLVAFAVGSELDMQKLRKVGRSILFIAIAESMAAFVLVAGATYLLQQDVAMAVILGAVASATAPAATVMVIRQYRAAGPLTTTILGVVGIDDAVALMIYSFAATAARAALLHTGKIDWGVMVGRPVVEILGALALGGALGLVGARLLRKVRVTDQLLTGTGMLLLAAAGLARLWELSPLLVNMALGMTLVNRNRFVKNRMAGALAGLSPLFFAMFFVLGGARLNIMLLPQIGLLGGVYLLARAAGKIGGATLGANLGSAPLAVRKYVGFGLLPQVGVAVALALMVDHQFGGGQFGPEGDRLASWVINVLLVTTIATETVGPLLTRVALERAGEAGMAPAEGDSR